MSRTRYLVLVLGLLGFALSASAESGFKVIANTSVSVDSMPAAQLSRIFLKKADKWPDGTTATPVDLKLGSPVRAAFSQAVHGKDAGAIEAYWQKRIFSGRALPPLTQASEAQVVAYVKATPGAVGYVSSSTSTAGVKVITVQ